MRSHNWLEPPSTLFCIYIYLPLFIIIIQQSNDPSSNANEIQANNLMAVKTENALSSSGYQSAENSDEAEESIVVPGIKSGSHPPFLQVDKNMLISKEPPTTNGEL